MSYSYYNDRDDIAIEEAREAKEQASIDRAEARRENPFLCQKEESALGKCRFQCELCRKAQQDMNETPMTF